MRCHHSLRLSFHLLCPEIWDSFHYHQFRCRTIIKADGDYYCLSQNVFMIIYFSCMFHYLIPNLNIQHLFSSFCHDFIQGVSKKTPLCVWQAIEGTRSGLQTKVGWVLKSSGNFLSDEHKNSSFLSENDWEKWVQRCLPPLRNSMLLDHIKIFFFCSHFNERLG